MEDKVDEFLDSLDDTTRGRVVRIIELLELAGAQLRMPYSKPIGSGIFELRIRGKQEIRVLYAFEKGGAILLHAFVKKNDKILRSHIESALKKRGS